MSDRLWERHKKRVSEGARRYLDHKKALRDFIGPGGIKLNREEQYQLYQEALNDSQMMLGILQNLQQQHKLRPEQVPRDFVEWFDKMRAMEPRGETEQ